MKNHIASVVISLVFIAVLRLLMHADNSRESGYSTAVEPSKSTLVAPASEPSTQLNQSSLVNATQTNADLWDAIERGNSIGVKRWLEAGASPNTHTKENYTALMKAARRGQNEIMQILIDKGADVSAVDDFGHSALYHAAGDEDQPGPSSDCSPSTLQVLIDNGADKDAHSTRDGVTPLMMVVANSVLDANLDAVKYLVDIGADINATDQNGATVLGSLKGNVFVNPEIEKLLVQAGAT